MHARARAHAHTQPYMHTQRETCTRAHAHTHLHHVSCLSVSQEDPDRPEPEPGSGKPAAGVRHGRGGEGAAAPQLPAGGSGGREGDTPAPRPPSREPWAVASHPCEGLVQKLGSAACSPTPPRLCLWAAGRGSGLNTLGSHRRGPRAQAERPAWGAGGTSGARPSASGQGSHRWPTSSGKDGVSRPQGPPRRGAPAPPPWRGGVQQTPSPGTQPTGTRRA